MKKSMSVKLALAIAVLAVFCHASDVSNRFFRLGTSIGLSYDFLAGKEGNLMNPLDFNGPGLLLAINTIFNFHDLPALRTGLTYNIRLDICVYHKCKRSLQLEKEQYLRN